MGKLTNLTVKGQVTIPKDVRDALGLKPGEPVEFDWNAAGEAVIRRAHLSDAVLEARKSAILSRIDAAAERFADLRIGEDTDVYMAEMREPVPLDMPSDR